jgi:hypothetical protein
MPRIKRNTLLKMLTAVGCFSTGIIYIAVGVIAILSFLKLKQGGADESSFFVLLNRYIAGRILNWLIVLGAVCFIIWRFYEAFKDPKGIGKDAKGILIRAGAAFSSGADAFIALSVLQALFARQKIPVTGEPVHQRQLGNQLLESEAGRTILIAAGVIILITALVLILYGLSKRFTESIRSGDFTKKEKYIIHVMAYAGYFSRGVILAITGFFLIKAAIKNNSSYIVNTDKAFDFIGDHVGHVWFIAVAIGTIAYGVYMFILGLHYDISAGKKKQK